MKIESSWSKILLSPRNLARDNTYKLGEIELPETK